MLEVQEITSVESYVKILGFRSPRDYAKSKLYEIVKGAILNRDNATCRAIGCGAKADCIGYVDVTLSSLAGNPYLIFSLCKAHYLSSRIVAPPYSEKLTTNKVFFLVSGKRKIKTVSNPQIGYWYKEQFHSLLNKETAEQIQRDIQLLSPGDWERVKEYWIKNTEE